VSCAKKNPGGRVGLVNSRHKKKKKSRFWVGGGSVGKC